MNTHDIELPSSDEAAAHMLPSDLKKFESGEHVAEAFSIAVGNPDETSQPLFTLDQVRAAIEADRQRRGESSSLAEVWRINADEAEAYGQPDRADTLRECAAEVERLAAPQPAEPRLDAPAQVGHTRFGYGVPWSTVIGAAQRYHAIENTPTKEQERMKKAAERLKAIQPAEPVEKSKNLQGSVVDKAEEMQGQPAEPAKVPSDADWQRLIGWLDRRRGYPSVQIDGKVAGDIADRLARYIQPAQPAQETIPRHVGETPAVPHLRDRLSEAHDACLDTNCVDCRAILREVLRILDSGSQPAGAAHE